MTTSPTSPETTTNSAVPEGPDLVIDGVRLPVLRPQSPAEVGETVRQARASSQALYPVGGGTLLDLGLPPARPGQVVALRGLCRVVDYPARDMTVTVEAGMTLGELQQLLAAENQRLPVDVPHPGRATLGGALAANVSGPRRHGLGTFRDYVLGISMVNDEGHEVKAGGRVVKNVAGYDLGKLYIGALGTLGIITQVTLKVVPRPEQQALVTLSTPEDRLSALLDSLHQSQTRPCCREMLNPAAVRHLNKNGGVGLPEGGWVVVVGFESNVDAVNWQVQQLIREIQSAYPLEARVGAAADPLWAALVESLPAIPDGLAFHAAILPSRCADFCRQVSALPEEPLVQARAGNGIVQVQLSQIGNQAQASALIAGCRQQLGAGSLVVWRCPAEWKNSEFVWGPPGDSLRLMRTIKEKLDPQKIFNPGRFVGGI
jgi:glycolate oxidase FAD binding subunit